MTTEPEQQGSATGAGVTQIVADLPGALELRRRQSRRFRDVADPGGPVTFTHWAIASATALGWMIDSLGASIYALIIPLLIVQFHSNLNQMTFDLLIVGLIAAAATYFWPWLADRIGRRPSFVINMLLTGAFLILTGFARSWNTFILFYALFLLAEVGEWGIASTLTAETWPARYRGSILSFARSFYGYGAALSGLVGTTLIAAYGWQAGYWVVAGIALLAVVVRFVCPESPYWVRVRDRKARIKDMARRGIAIPEADQDWKAKADRPSVGQLFLVDQRRRTIVAVFVALTATAAFATVGAWQPLYLSEAHHWSLGQYSNYILWWGLVGAAGYYFCGWIADRWSRLGAMLAGNVICIAFIIPWSLVSDKWMLYAFGLAANFGLIGVWGTVLTYTAELFPTRIRGVGQGFAWALAGLFTRGVPYAALWIRDQTGSFQAAFLIIPGLLAIQIIGLWIGKEEHAGQSLDAIAV